ncbi:disulfide bond formation protein DsbA [Rhodococcus sp. SRB_17]|nr:disulfide bond formation protein DsbA [Rhodococcus sp. SRB_17]
MKVEIYSDVLCPWCYIGKRRLAAALSTLADAKSVELVWRSFELAPEDSGIPGETAAEAMAGWWGDEAPSRIARIRSLGTAEGLELNMHLSRPVSSFDAHRLSKLAADRGRVDQMMELLLHAYHTEGLNLADPHVLRRLGREAGLDADEVLAVQAGDAYADEGRADRSRGAEHGVTGVPTLMIDGGTPVSAIQPISDLRQLLEPNGAGSHSVPAPLGR